MMMYNGINDYNN